MSSGMTMKRLIYPLLAIVLLPAWSTGAAIAQPVPQVPRLTPAQLQRFSRDLVPSSSEEFFRQGRETLEQEVQRLRQPHRFSSDQILKISQDVTIQHDLLQFERPPTLPHDSTFIQQ